MTTLQNNISNNVTEIDSTSQFCVGEEPVLIVGYARSGTTWLGKIFDSHPSTLYCNEPERECSIKAFAERDMHSHQEGRKSAIREYFDEIRQFKYINTYGLHPVFRKINESFIPYCFRNFATHVSRYAAQFSVSLPYPQLGRSSKFDSLRLVWKSVNSLSKIDDIVYSIPELHVIHILRHPCAVIASRIRGQNRGDFKKITIDSRKYKEIERFIRSPSSEGISLYEGDITKLSMVELEAIRWAMINQKVIKELEPIPHAEVVKYEDLCDNPILQAKSLFESTKLEWHEQTERFIRKSTITHRSRYYSLYKNPQIVANKWRDELDRETQNLIISAVADTLPGKLFI